MGKIIMRIKTMSAAATLAPKKIEGRFISARSKWWRPWLPGVKANMERRIGTTSVPLKLFD